MYFNNVDLLYLDKSQMTFKIICTVENIRMLRKYYVPHPKILDDSIDESWSLVSLNYFLIGMFEKLQ